MIGVSAKIEEISVVEEFFELFKTPWEFVSEGSSYDVLLVTSEQLPPASGKVVLVYSSKPLPLHGEHGIELQPRPAGVAAIGDQKVPLYKSYATLDRESIAASAGNIIFLGYDLFSEIRFLLGPGQPPEHALCPTLDLHVSLLRDAILRQGLSLIEIPPQPAGAAFWACLTHDIDFVSLRQHRFDHTMAGFLVRATLGSVVDLLAGRKSIGALLRNLFGVAKLPFVYLGLCRDYWMPFPEYLKAENGRPSTFFIIPFKRQPGVPQKAQEHSRRATAYDISDLADWPSTLAANGCELGLHGLDAWNSVDHARKESDRIQTITSQRPTGVRMHWLYFAENSPAILDQAGFEYDSTSGYNNAVGYRAGTAQVFKPLNSHHLLELPMHIQDTALFYPGRMHLRPTEAWRLCQALIANANRYSGVLTLLWHDRSLVPERLWDRFYARLLAELDSARVCWGTADTVTRWFRGRRSMAFRSAVDHGDSVEVILDNIPSHSSRGYLLRVSRRGPDGRVEITEKPIEGRARLTILHTSRPQSNPSHLTPNSQRNTESALAV